MTKIKAIYKQDLKNKKGRKIHIKWETDNENVNSYLKLPRNWHRQFEVNVTNTEVNDAFTAETVPLVQNAEVQLNISLAGLSFEVDT